MTHPCAFFFSSQTSVSAGRILRMGKGFTIEGVEGYDLSTLFQEAFERKVTKCAWARITQCIDGLFRVSM